MLLAANAYRIWDTFEARSSLIAALSSEGQPSGEFDTAGATTGAVAVNANAGDQASAGGGVADLTSIAVSPDDRWVASGSRDGVIYLWERAGKGHPRTFALPNGAAIEHVAYSPDGRYLAAGDDAGMIWLVNGGSGTLNLLGSFQAEPVRINGLAWGQAGDLYSLGKNDVTQWQVSDGKATEVARRSAQQARAFALDPALYLLAVAYEDGSIAEWRLDARGTLPAAPSEHLEGYPNTPTSVAISETGEIAAGYESGLVVKWPAAGSKSRALRFAGSMDNAVTGLAWGPQAEWLAASGRNHEAVVWDAKAGGVRERWRGHSDAVEAITVAPNGEACFTAGQDGRVLEWPEPGATHVGPFVRQAQGHRDEIWSVAFSPAQGAPSLAATGGKDGQVRLWTITNANVDSKVVLQEDVGVRHVAFSDDGGWLAAGDETGRVMLWQIKDGAALEPHATYKHGGGFINGLVITPDALISAGPVDPSVLDNQLKAWPLTASGAALLGASDPISPVMAMKKDAQDGIWVLTQDGKLITGRWSAPSKAFVKDRDLDVAPRDGSAATSLAILKAGDQIALGMSNGRLALIAPGARTTVGQRVSFDANSKNLSALAFSPDGKLLASAGWDGQIMLWDVATRRRLGEPLSTGDLAISDIEFSSDGRWLAVASDNRTFMLYGATPEQWVKAACQTAGRALTKEERDRYLDGRDGQACSP